MNPQEKRKNSKFREMMSLQIKSNITLHQSRYFSEPSSLETPSKYEYLIGGVIAIAT